MSEQRYRVEYWPESGWMVLGPDTQIGPFGTLNWKALEVKAALDRAYAAALNREDLAAALVEALRKADWFIAWMAADPGVTVRQAALVDHARKWCADYRALIARYEEAQR